MEQLFAFFGIDPIIILLVISGGFFATRYLKSWTWMSDAWKTLIVGSVFSAAYIWIVFHEKEMTAIIWKSFLISYVFATSFYELGLKWLVKKIESANNGD